MSILPIRLTRHVVSVCAALTLVAAGPAAGQMMGTKVSSLVSIDLLELQAAGADRPIVWDASGWIGGDYTRLWIKSEGAIATRGDGKEAEVQVLYSHLVSPFWELQAGARLETQSHGGARATRASLVLGLEGLAPYWFELEPALFVSQDGDLSARVTATYDLFVTQRVILQPRLEANAALQRMEQFGVGSGLNDLDLGFRLRYEVKREFAPYIGARWAQKIGGTASMARDAGDATGSVAFVGGLRMWF